MCDDVTLISSDPNELQRLINITKDYSFIEGYQLQEVKSVILRVKPPNVNIMTMKAGLR